MFIKGNLIGFSTRFQKGHTLNKGKTPKCCFKKGHIMSEETRRKISLKMVGRSKNDAKNWKGNQADYYTIHKWVHLKKGKPKKCLICGLVGKYVSFKNGEKWNLDWASKDHSYSRNLDDYIPLCKKCHRKYDIDRSQWSGGRPKK